MASRPQTLGELRKKGYQIDSVKDELRRNLLLKLKNREPLFPEIIGFDKTVIPALVNAILAKHDIILLGLRGQAKTKIIRLLPTLLDEFIPIVKGSEVNDNPFQPISKYAIDLVAEAGDATPIEWIHRDQRYGEKLATPDVTIADLIGDIDPIKAAAQRLHYSHEGAIHFGIIPRTNRGIFAINELPDLQPRIQVGLLNIMQEKDIQIRGFKVRIPLDVMIVYTANPEDYTNRGNIITPLKDRIDSQILTHYPKTIDHAIKITDHEAWVKRDDQYPVILPNYLKELVEQIAFEARKSDYVDHKSGVSARMSISVMENLISNAERRAIFSGENMVVPRFSDFHFALPGMTGKMELVFEGEQEGAVKVGKALIGKAVREVFINYFPEPYPKKPGKQGRPADSFAPRGGKPVNLDVVPAADDSYYQEIINWFNQGNKLELADEMNSEEYFKQLDKIPGLKRIATQHLKPGGSKAEVSAVMEFVLEALYQNSRLAKEEAEVGTVYKDMLGSLFRND